MLIKLKFRFPEIVIGILLSVAIFAMGMTFESSRSQPSSYPAQQPANSSGAPIAPEYAANKLTDWLLVGLNLFLVVSTYMLWRANNRSAKVAERALTELEAPFIAVNIIAAGIEFNNLLNIGFGDLKFSFVNYGRTPAHILDFTERITPVKSGASLPPPIDPIKERGAPMPYGVIAPPESETQPFKTPAQFDFFETAVEHPGSIWEITQRP
jgi:hypothetical protein